MIVTPWNTVAKMLAWFGFHNIVVGGLTVYVYRIMCAGIGLFGIFLIMLALNLTRYKPMVKLAGLGFIFVGLIAIATGFWVKMAPPWYIADGGFSVLFGLLITVLGGQLKPEASQACLPVKGEKLSR
ncbi:MAG: hypothetical protein HY811_09320 [Planctomycetes bacterium]|nr:hypothetical protein [Planctomycetota bacterium]